MMKTFIVYNEIEADRVHLVKKLQAAFPMHQIVKAVYPNETHVPFIHSIQAVSKKRTGRALSIGEIGCLLSHRKVWREIVKGSGSETEAYMIVESDAIVKEAGKINDNFKNLHQHYDVFFWGAFEGRTQLFRSSVKKMEGDYQVGIPFIKSLYCTYGYSINKKAANYLLKVTGLFDHPVDLWKRNLKNTNLKIGAVKPEIIAADKDIKTNIQNAKTSFLKQWILYFLVEIKNRIIVYFR